MLRRLVALLPCSIQYEARRLNCRRRIRNGTFRSREPEFFRLKEWISPGDWVIDVGANVGIYTIAMSQAVGPAGRVFSFEPGLETFAILTDVIRQAPYKNVTSINAAVSDRTREVRLRTPLSEDGLRDYPMASIRDDGEIPVMAYPLDSFEFPHRISLIKVDTEGHEKYVIAGMKRLIERDSPVLLLEDGAGLVDLLPGYRVVPAARSSLSILSPV